MTKSRVVVTHDFDHHVQGSGTRGFVSLAVQPSVLAAVNGDRTAFGVAVRLSTACPLGYFSQPFVLVKVRVGLQRLRMLAYLPSSTL